MDSTRNLLDYIEEIVVVLDHDDRIVAFNREANRVLSALSMTPLKAGAIFLDHLPPYRRADVERILLRTRTEQTTVQTFAEHRMPGGATLFLDLSYIPYTDTSTSTTFIQVVGRDVTTEKAFEKKMTSLVAEVTDLFDNANALIFSTDSRGYVTHWNKHCDEILGYNKDEIFAQKVDILIDSNDRDTFNEVLTSAMAGKTIGRTEVPLVSRNGHKLTAMLSATPRLNEKKLVTGVTFVGQDVTELIAYRTSLERTVQEKTRELREALQKQEEALEVKSKFVSIASHEFRTPLKSLQHTARMLAERYNTLQEEELMEKFAFIEYHTSNMLHLLDDVLLYGKSEPGKIRIVLSPIPLPSFLQQIIEEVTLSMNNTHNVVLQEELLDGITSDEKLLRNILINLLTNAIKFSPQRKQVYLSAKQAEDSLTIRVRDEGIGIPPEDMNSLFQPFLRATNASQIPGTGLGLSIVRKAVDLLSGSIFVESYPEKGTTVTVTIPDLKNNI